MAFIKLNIMKNALIITNLSGFLLKFETNNVKLLQSLGYKVHFASNKNEKGYPFELDQIEELGVEFHNIDIARSPYMWRMNYRAIKQVRKIIINNNIDIIHCHTPVGALIGRLSTIYLEKKKSPKVIYTAHGFHFYKGAPILNNTLFKAVEYFLAPLTDVLIVINSEDFEQAKKLHLKKGGIIKKIPGVGIDLTRFSPVSEIKKYELREKHNIPQDIFYILSVGELNLNKNHKTVIRTIYEIYKDDNNFKLMYTICGEGYWQEDLQNLINRLRLEDNVRILGFHNNIEDYYAMSDITIFPSRREGLGMAGVESLAMGIPVIAADNRGTKEYMKNGHNGFVCSYNDVKAFKKAIYRYINLTNEEKKYMRENCPLTIKSFDKNITNDIMKDIYIQIDQEVDNARKTTN